MSVTTVAALEASPAEESRSDASVLLRRLISLALLFVVELTVISMRLDGPNLARRSSIAWFVAAWGDWVLRGIVGFAVLFATFSWLRNRAAVNAVSVELAASPVSFRLITAHLGTLGLFGVASYVIYGNVLSGSTLNVAFILWMILGCAAIALGSIAFIPAALWARIFTSSGRLWSYSLAAILAACISGFELRWLWRPTTAFTFQIVALILRPFLPNLTSDPANLTLSTPRFGVEISQACSGLEGAGLMLGFGVLWLILFRKECRFPQALLLIPAGIAALFFLNSVRIAALILIGNAGAEEIAAGGFHSQAGWIAFNLVALGFSLTAGRVQWFTRQETERLPKASTANSAVARYVLPLVVLLASGMAARAMTGTFEWLYPIRLLAGIAVLWAFRREYLRRRDGSPDWRFGWFGIAAGALVFASWMALDRLTGIVPASIPSELAAAPARLRLGWEIARTLAAVVTVPIIEELAFRGFLLRRLVSSDFEKVNLTRIPWFALAISAVFFGVLHGDRWIAGTIAGLLYGYAFVRKGRIGDAVIAHAVTNALIAVAVLGFNQWQLW